MHHTGLNLLQSSSLHAGRNEKGQQYGSLLCPWVTMSVDKVNCLGRSNSQAGFTKSCLNIQTDAEHVHRHLFSTSQSPWIKPLPMISKRQMNIPIMLFIATGKKIHPRV